MEDADLAGRVALVTGSASGLGRGLALALADAGADVAVHYHSSDAEAATTAADAEAFGVSSTTVQGDVTDPESVDAMFESVEADLGGVDVLVNNVGDFDPRHWEEIGLEDWNRVISTNLTGTMLCSRRALPAMRQQEWGRIVNVGYAGSEKALTGATSTRATGRRSVSRTGTGSSRPTSRGRCSARGARCRRCASRSGAGS